MTLTGFHRRTRSAATIPDVGGQRVWLKFNIHLLNVHIKEISHGDSSRNTVMMSGVTMTAAERIGSKGMPLRSVMASGGRSERRARSETTSPIVLYRVRKVLTCRTRYRRRLPPRAAWRGSFDHRSKLHEHSLIGLQSDGLGGDQDIIVDGKCGSHDEPPDVSDIIQSLIGAVPPQANSQGSDEGANWGGSRLFLTKAPK